MNILKLPELSVFFPLYNEEENVERLVAEALRVFPDVARKFEIILIDDGSQDSTAELAYALSRKYREIKVISQENTGYGGALKRGFLESQYDWVFFSDGDLQFDLWEINKLTPYIDEFDLIIGYRMNRADGFVREFVALMLKIWNRILLGFPSNINDIDCAFKLIKREVISTVNPLASDGAMLSTEFLLKAHKKGFKIKQVGVTHFERKFGHSTGNDLNVIFKAVKDTFILRKLLSNKS